MDTADPDDVAATGESVAGEVELPDGRTMPVTLPPGLVEQAEANGVDADRLAEAAVPASATVNMTADTRTDESSTIPVQDHRHTDLTSRLRRQREYQYVDDPQIQRLIENGVNYTERVGDFLLAEDDLIPTAKERLKALITGEDGIDPEPADPDDDADQRLAEHLQDLYDEDIRPTEVIDAILRENIKNARAVLRSTDLKELDLNSLDYLRDGISGEEIYVQDRTTVYEFDVDDEAERGDGDAIAGIDLEQRTVDAQPLVIGEHVFDISLYDQPPLEAVADTAVNKMVLQRLKARKAEITSFGAVYASVEPPSYLQEDEYFTRVQDDDWNEDEDGAPPTKLERAMKQNIQDAFDTLKDFQSGTVMSVPDFWTLEQLEIPETGDPLDDQIRGYNRDISRRLLLPLDLIELQSGSELSRETMFATLMTTISGWRREIARVFDQFAEVQADIHGIDGDVNHTFPPLKDADTEQIVSALQYAGPAGLSQKEVRQMLNTIRGVDLDTDDATGDMPTDGGPDDPAARQEQMEQMLQEQRRGETPDDGADTPPDGSDPNPPAATAASQAAADLLRDVPFLPTPEPEGTTRISENALKDWLAWVRAGRPDMEAAWNPAFHPRGPNGQFVERPYDIPDEVVSEVRDLSPAETLDRLAGTSELNDGDVETLLQDDKIAIDGVPDDASTRKDLFDMAQDDSPDDGAPAAEQGYMSPGAPDLRVGEAESVEPLLEDPEGASGSAATNMDVARFDDGTVGFVKYYRDDPDGERSDGEKPTLAEREVAADQALRNMGFGDHLPALFNNDDEGYSVSEKVEGEHARMSAPAGADAVDEDEFKDFAAATMLIGNSDLHGDNWVVQDDGSFAAIDLNKSGGDFTSGGKFRRRGRDMVLNVADTLGIDFDADELTERAGELARDADVDDVLSGVENSGISDSARHQYRENMRANMEAFAAGEVDL